MQIDQPRRVSRSAKLRTVRGKGFAAAVVLLLSGCGDGNSGPTLPPSPLLATVRIAYVAATTTDPGIAQRFPDCVNGVGRTHLHPSWRNFATLPLDAAGDRWTLTFTDVPVGVENRFRINDPNGCDQNPTGAVTDPIFANDVRLTRIISTPGNGPEPGLAFTVDANGSVTP